MPSGVVEARDHLNSARDHNGGLLVVVIACALLVGFQVGWSTLLSTLAIQVLTEDSWRSKFGGPLWSWNPSHK